MEQYSIAYVSAIAAAAGCNLLSWKVDNDSIDMTLARRSPDSPNRAPRLDLQMKATAVCSMTADHLAFPLSIKNYDDLRAENISCPRILVVLLVHPEVQDWTDQTEQELALRRCGYWCSLRGLPAVENSTTKTVYVPRAQVLDVAALHDIFVRLENWQQP